MVAVLIVMIMKSKCELRDFEDNIYFKDKNDRYIMVRSYDFQQDRNELINMYGKFDPEDRCLGLPPVKEEALMTWLDYIDDKGISIIAEHNEEIVGHLSVVPCGNEIAEVSIFIIKSYQNAGIGRKMVNTFLDHCKKVKCKKIILTTEKCNNRALHLFTKVGFAITDDRYQYDMNICLGEYHEKQEGY